jgi:hypothetical protein
MPVKHFFYAANRGGKKGMVLQGFQLLLFVIVCNTIATEGIVQGRY